MLSIIDQLWNIYQHEDWHKNRLIKAEADKYHTKLYALGNIATCYDNDILVGYAEIWFLNHEQLGRIICGEHFSAYLEDVQNGYIAWLANIYIKPEYRKTQTLRILRDKFYSLSKHCKYYSGHALRKSVWMIKMFKNKEDKNGK